MGLIQGGDPLSKDPAKRAMYGTGGLGMLAQEFNSEPVTRGAVAAVLQPGKPDSAGSQFFVAVSDQVALNGTVTVFGRVVEGLEVVQAISEAPVDEKGRVTERIEILSVTIRDAPPPEPVPFSTETVEELAQYRAVIETTEGAITITFDPVKAPQHVRNFLRLASAGVYDGTSFHRIVKGFVIQTGLVQTREKPLTQRQLSYVTTLQPEFNDTLHVAGIVSMARTSDPASASTSFFICTAPAPSLDNAYTVFGRVVSGMGVVQTIEAKRVDGETPVERVDLIRVRAGKGPEVGHIARRTREKETHLRRRLARGPRSHLGAPRAPGRRHGPDGGQPHGRARPARDLQGADRRRRRQVPRRPVVAAGAGGRRCDARAGRRPGLPCRRCWALPRRSRSPRCGDRCSNTSRGSPSAISTRRRRACSSRGS